MLEGPVAPPRPEPAPSSWRRYLGRLPGLPSLASSPQSVRRATAAHGASLVAAFAFWTWLGRGLWFYGDEWDFLVRRGLSFGPSSHRSIWFPHNEHWSTLPILLWRGIYSVFHLSSYWPYLIPVLLAQLAVMHLEWRLCRRAGVDAWVATAAVTLLGFLGSGTGDLLSGFQIGFVGAVLFGLIAIDLIDRPVMDSSPGAGPGQRRRDVLASVALLASLMCSTVGDTMVVGAAVLLFARRPPKRALAVLALPVTSYVIWFAALGRPGISAPRDTFGLSSLTALPGYVWYGLSTSLGLTFNLQEAGTAILVGLAAWVIWHMRSLWRECPALLGLCAASLTFYALAGLGRDLTAGALSVAVSRYIYVAVAVLIPVIAMLLSSASTWPAARLMVIAFLAATVVGDIGQAQSWASTAVTAETDQKVLLAATARLLASGVPDVSGLSASPVGLYPSLSAASIDILDKSGYVPHVPVTPADLANARALLAVGTWNGIRTSLLTKPLFTGRFGFVTALHGAATWQGNGCLEVDPETLSPAMQVWLRVPSGQKGASVHVSAAPAAPGLTNYLAGLLVPSTGPAPTVPVQVEMPNAGTGYLSDNDPGTVLVLLWDIGTPLTFCGLSGAPHS